MSILEQAVAQLEGSIIRAGRSNDRLSVRTLQQAQQVILEVIAAESSVLRLVASDADPRSDVLYVACMQDASELLDGDTAQSSEAKPKSVATT